MKGAGHEICKWSSKINPMGIKQVGHPDLVGVASAIWFMQQLFFVVFHSTRVEDL